MAPNYPAGAALGALYRQDREAGLRATWLLARLHAFDLERFGITADCLPVLDVPVEGASEVIGGKGVNIVKAEIAGKGTFWRVRVPAGSRGDAVSLCESYKAAGGNCFVSR